MISKKKLYELLENTNLNPWKAEIFEKVYTVFSDKKHGDLEKWKMILESLPQIKPTIINLNTPTIQIGTESDIESDKRNSLQSLLKKLHPWRKGPFNLFGIFIDTEWRSDFKWNRFKDHISPLKDRIILDVGCGNGYHVIQFQAINHFVNSQSIQILPLSIEKLQYTSQAFDTIFSMGVLYHQRSPFDHLSELRTHLRSGGELVLETLVIDGGKNEVLVPENRYAKMRNVWFIPSCLTLESWLKRSRFKNIRMIDVTKTRTKEQRSTEWMHYESLTEFLDPDDSDKTVEGLPAPKRAIFLAETS